MSKIAFVTGVSGQDGSYMVDYLLKNTDYLVFGGVRRLSVTNYKNIQHITSDRFALVNFDLSDTHSIDNVVNELKPDYFINFAAQSFVGSSWEFPAQTWECNTTGVLHILESIRKHAPKCRMLNAGSSEEFGNVQYTPQTESHPLKPRSPYGASKAAARMLIKTYRESYNLYAIQGYVYNHESVRRGEEFVTRKITKNVARIKKALLNNEPFIPLELGNIESRRDWSDAEDIVHGLWLMLNQDTPKEYILSSDSTHTIKEFVELAFKYANIEGAWHGNNINTEFSLTNNSKNLYDAKSSILVKINPSFFRPAEVDLLYGDSTAARNELKWYPKTTFTQLVEKMVMNDLSIDR